MGFRILMGHGFVAQEMRVFFEKVKRAAIKREGKLNLRFFCVASYGGNPWCNRERHYWIECLAVEVGTVGRSFAYR